MRITKYNQKRVSSNINDDHVNVTINDETPNDNNINIILPNELLSCPSSVALLLASYIDYIMRLRDQIPEDIAYYHKREKVGGDAAMHDDSVEPRGPQRHHEHIKLKKRRIFTIDFQAKIDAIESLCRQNMNRNNTSSDNVNSNNGAILIHLLIGASVNSAKEAYHLNINYQHRTNDNNDCDPQLKARLLDRSIRMMLRSMIVYNTNQKLKKALPLTNTYLAIHFDNDDTTENDVTTTTTNNDNDDDDDAISDTFMRREEYKVKAKNMKKEEDFFLNITPKGDTNDDTYGTKMITDDENDILHGYFITKKGLKGVK